MLPFAPTDAQLYASHRDWVERIAERMVPHRLHPRLGARSTAIYHGRVQVPWESAPWAIHMPGYQPEGMRGEVEERERARLQVVPSFESPVGFDGGVDGTGRAPLPLNPRGRTGVQGKGALAQWGPHHEVHVLVTRYDPRTHRLQVAVVMHEDRMQSGREPPQPSRDPQAELEPFVELPSAPVADRVKGSDEAVRAMEALRALRAPFNLADNDLVWPPAVQSAVDVTFSGTGGPITLVYTGVKDDPRNTDHAWVETCVVHAHASLEAGGQIDLQRVVGRRDWQAHGWGLGGSGRSVARDRLEWVNMLDCQPHLRSSESEWLSLVVERLRVRERPGLLQYVARWGRTDVLATVLSDPDLLDHCQPAQVQAAFGEALQYATQETFDVGVVALLLNHGAKPSDVYGPGLLEVEKRSNQMRTRDAFGLIDMLRTKRKARRGWGGPSGDDDGLEGGGDGGAALHDSRYDGGPLSARLTPRQGGGDLAPITPQKARGLGTSGGVSGTSSPARTLSRPPSRTSLSLAGSGVLSAPPYTTPPATPSRALRVRLLGYPGGASHAGHSAPWSGLSRELLERAVPGFAAYTDSSSVLSLVDIAFWGLACGRYDLVRELWSRCRSPLRTALILNEACRRIKLDSPAYIDTLALYQARFNSMALGLLEHLGSSAGKDASERARLVLLSCAGPTAMLGNPTRTGKPSSVLDLTMFYHNRNFASHRHFQGVIDALWYGRSSASGPVRIVETRPHQLKVLMQILLPWAPLLRCARNDLFDPQLAPLSACCTSRLDGDRAPSALERMVGLYQIPMVKRTLVVYCQTAFLLLFSYLALLEPCGPLETTHYVGALWACSLLVQEAHQMVSNPVLYRRYWLSNLIDLLILALCLVASWLRLRLVEPYASSAVDLVDYVNQRAGYATREGVEDPLPADFVHAACGWCIDLELLRTVLGCVAVLLSMRMMEGFALLPDTGILLITATSMLVKMAAWLPLVFLLSFGWAVAMNVLAPFYRLEHSPGALRLPGAPDGFTLDLSSGGPFFSPFWAIYGYVEPGSLAAGRGTAVVAPIAMWLYLIICLVLFVNLLIAIFNDTYSSVQAEKSQVWKMSRVLLVKLSMEGLPLPAPFNLPLIVFFLFRQLLFCLRNRGGCRCDGVDRASVLPEAFAEGARDGSHDSALGGLGGGRAGASSRAAAKALARARAERLELAQVEEIERQARLRFLRADPHFEQTAASSGESTREQLSEIRELSSRGVSTLQDRLGKMELKLNHKHSYLERVLEDLRQTVDSSMGIGGVASAGNADDAQAGIDDALAIQTFRKYDRDQSGDIDAKELPDALIDLGMRLEDVHVAAMIRRYDVDNTASFDLSEFKSMVREIKEFQRAHARAIKVFAEHDKDGSGVLSANELVGALDALGFEKFSEQQIGALIAMYDVGNVNHGIDIQQFTRLVGDQMKFRRAETKAATPQLRVDVGTPAIHPQPPPPPHAGGGGGAGFARYDVGRPEWLDEAPAWWQAAEQSRRDSAESYGKSLKQDVLQLRAQSAALAQVTTHLTQEVARLRPEYWQRAHLAPMAGPRSAHTILTPPEPRLRPGRGAGTGAAPAPALHLNVPNIEGPIGREERFTRYVAAQRGLSHLPPSHPIAYPHDYRELERVFSQFDYDLNGTLDARELRRALNALGLQTSSEQAASVLRKYDRDRSGAIDIGEFRALVAELRRFQSMGGATDDVQRTFIFHDRDGNARIDHDELAAALNALGLRTDSTQATQVLKRYDADGSGFLELTEVGWPTIEPHSQP